MADNQITRAFSLIENDESKILQMAIGQHENIKPGTRLGRKGTRYPKATAKQAKHQPQNQALPMKKPI